MKRPIFYDLAALLALAILLAGCGGPTPPPISYTPGQSVTYTVGGVPFAMHYVPGGLTFPTEGYVNPRSEDFIPASTATVGDAYWIAETEVTYELWNTVKTWATTDATNKYTFVDSDSDGTHGIAGSSGSGSVLEPVTNINWREAMIWCNALTEYYNATNTDGIVLTCVYTSSSGAIVRDATATDICDNVIAGPTAKGFRLPTGNEWEMAARYIGTTAPTTAPLSDEKLTLSGIYWTPGTYASGATGDYSTEDTDEVAVYNTTGTAVVKSKGASGANALGLYDMSGNVGEFCFDQLGSYYRILCGGYCNQSAVYIQLALWGNTNSEVASRYFGFRPVRTN